MTGANTTIPAVGGTVQINIVGTYSDGSTKDVTTMMQIGSSDATVASVMQSGLTTGWAVGQVTITAYLLLGGDLTPKASGTLAVATGPATDPTLVPTLLSPDDGATITESQTGILTFNWSTVPGATAYHLNLKGESATFPAIDKPDIANPPYQITTAGIDTGTLWHWLVQAQVNGTFQAWSPPRMLSFTAGAHAMRSSAALPWPVLSAPPAPPTSLRGRPGKSR